MKRLLVDKVPYAGPPDVVEPVGAALPDQLLGHAADGLDVALDTIRSEGRPGKVLLEIVDDGVGIAEEDLSSIFDPFFTTKGRGKGTGLGLSITFGIVREHGGRIRADSPPGEGACFRVELPTADRAEALA